MRREALSGLLLLALLALAVFVCDEAAGPGPLSICVSVAAVHAAVLAPAMARGNAPWWGFLPALLCLPALCATAYGHPGAAPLLGSILLVALAAAAGSAARALHGRAEAALYLPSVLLLFAVPYALRYLVLEFGGGGADAWALASPFAAAERVAGGAAPPAVSVLLLLAWPVWAIARRRR